MKMAMRYFESGNDEANTVALIEILLCQTNLFSDNHQMA